MGIPIRVSGAWVESSAQYVRVSGEWKPCKNVYVRQGGVWLSVYPLTKALSSLTNDIAKSTTISNVRVGSTITVTYSATNNVYDSSDYIGVGWYGCTVAAVQNGWVDSSGNWHIGPNGGTYTATFTATSSEVTFSIWGHGMSSATGSATYFYEKEA